MPVINIVGNNNALFILAVKSFKLPSSGFREPAGTLTLLFLPLLLKFKPTLVVQTKDHFQDQSKK
jgi:hypothetical protein